ncbi:SDR family NAD(P)-dependent oxidoreductase [Acidiphilium sp. C61]|uniref:SDR family oxidoreductase n=1 Tax=Acidiphilium sp. C61 TaxID=1671485 RepID=UPI00157AF4D9|nr:SDR family NAD(P)-dependent oxidoreductase [Acidiphilium sp. C61]
MENRFEGKTAVITGGAAGIGLAAATRIIAEGGNAILWDRSREAIVAAAQDLGPSCSGVSLDVTDLRALERAAAEAVREHGAIDVLIASAGITGPNAPTWDYPLDAWRQVIEVNLTGVFCACKAVVPHMRARNAGRIVNIASIAGKEGNPNAPAYSASKAGVIGLTKSLGKELAGTPITVNCITPAAVRTAIFEQMSQQHIDYMLSKIPMNRFGTVEEIAALICFLASDEASFSTGAVFDISGGRATY